MSFKIVLIGGGSYKWTPKLAADLFLRQGLMGSHLSLVDIDAQAAETMKEYCELMNSKLSSQWKITVDDLDSALQGANIVCISISTGGLKTMNNDYTIPEKYGIYHCIGDTTGPGGISRTLRNVPVFLEIARKMERFCPHARLVHVTNPLSQLTRAVSKSTSIETVGLCHNFYWTRGVLAKMFKVESEDIDAVSVGVNHFTLMKNITCKGRSIEKELSLKKYILHCMEQDGEAISNTTDDMINSYLSTKNEGRGHQLNFEFYDMFGFLPVGGSNHVAENFPYFTSDLQVLKNHQIQRKGVFPRRQVMHDSEKQKVVDVVEGRAELPEFKLSFEGLSIICEALHTGNTAKCVVAMPNKGQISNLPSEIIVETWAMITANGVHPVISGEIPTGFKGYMNQVIEEQELTVEAAIEGSRQKLYQAMSISPMVHNKDIAIPLSDELLEANKDYLPQFFK